MVRSFAFPRFLRSWRFATLVRSTNILVRYRRAIAGCKKAKLHYDYPPKDPPNRRPIFLDTGAAGTPSSSAVGSNGLLGALSTSLAVLLPTYSAPEKEKPRRSRRRRASCPAATSPSASLKWRSCSKGRSASSECEGKVEE